MRGYGVCCLILAGSLLASCTPSHTGEQTRRAAETVRLLDGVDIERSHHRRIGSQAWVCLVGDDSLPNAESLLQLAERGFAAEFAVVAVERQLLSYLEMIQVRPCSHAEYLIHIAAACAGDCHADPLMIRIVNADGTRFDHVRMSLRGGWWRFGNRSAEQQQAAFNRLARELAGD